MSLSRNGAINMPLQWHQIAIVALVGAVVSTLLFALVMKAPALSDQLDYFFSAASLPDISPTHRHLRIGLIFPVSGLIALFGYSQIAYFAIPFLTMLMLFVATALLGTQLFSLKVGLVAAAFMVMVPPYLTDASHLLPDYFAAALFTLAVVGVVEATRSTGTSRMWILAILSGFLLGWSYLVREYVAVLFPCLGLAMLLMRAERKVWIGFCSGALFGWSIEAAWGWLNYGNPLIRLLASGAPRDTERPFSMDVTEILLLLPTTVAARPLGWLVAAFLVFGLVAIIVGCFSRRPGWILLGTWGLLGWIFFTAIGLAPVVFFDGESVFLRMHKFRYWAIMLPPLVIGAVAALFWAWNATAGRGRWPMRGAVVCLLMLSAHGFTTGAASVIKSTRSPKASSVDYAEFREFMRSELAASRRSIWVTTSAGIAGERSLPIFLMEWHGVQRVWEGEVRALNAKRGWHPPEHMSSGLIVLDRTRLPNSRSGYPDHLVNPGSRWPEVFRSSNGYVVVHDTEGALTDTVASAGVTIAPSSLRIRTRASATDSAVARALPDKDGSLELTVEESGAVVLLDDRGKGLRAPAESGFFSVQPGEPLHVRLRAAGARDALNRMRVRCMFFDPQGTRHAVRGRSTPRDRGKSMQQQVTLEFTCAPPASLVSAGIPLDFRLALEASGPMSIRLHGIAYGVGPALTIPVPFDPRATQ